MKKVYLRKIDGLNRGGRPGKMEKQGKGVCGWRGTGRGGGYDLFIIFMVIYHVPGNCITGSDGRQWGADRGGQNNAIASYKCRPGSQKSYITCRKIISAFSDFILVKLSTSVKMASSYGGIVSYCNWFCSLVKGLRKGRGSIRQISAIKMIGKLCPAVLNLQRKAWDVYDKEERLLTKRTLPVD